MGFVVGVKLWFGSYRANPSIVSPFFIGYFLDDDKEGSNFYDFYFSGLLSFFSIPFAICSKLVLTGSILTCDLQRLYTFKARGREN